MHIAKPINKNTTTNVISINKPVKFCFKFLNIYIFPKASSSLTSSPIFEIAITSSPFKSVEEPPGIIALLLRIIAIIIQSSGIFNSLICLFTEL